MDPSSQFRLTVFEPDAITAVALTAHSARQLYVF